MEIDEFIKKYNGKFVEVAGPKSKNQCVDLANAYIDEVLRFPMITYANAKDFPKKAGKRYQWIKNTPLGIPQKGDIIIWGGKYGHIAIFISGSARRFRSFDQNYPTGSPAHIQKHTYAHVLGWLRPIINSSSNMDYKKKYEEKVRLETRLRGAIEKKDKEIEILKIDNKTYQNENKQMKKDIANLQKELKLALNSHKTSLAKDKLDCQKKLDDGLARMGKDWDIKEGEYKKEIEGLKEELKKKEVVVVKRPSIPKDFLGRLRIALNLMKGRWI